MGSVKARNGVSNRIQRCPRNASFAICRSDIRYGCQSVCGDSLSKRTAEAAAEAQDQEVYK